MSHEELDGADYEWKEYSLGFHIKPDFDDIRNVQRFLLMKRNIKKIEKVMYQGTGASLYPDMGLNSLIGL